MKRLPVIAILLVFSVYYSSSQHRIVTIKGDTINSEVIDLNRNNLVFYGFIRSLKDSKIDLNEVKVLYGTPKFRINPIIKINPNITFIEEKKPKDFVDDYYTSETPLSFRFALTAEGFKKNRDLDKDYVVVDFPKFSQEQLFKRVLLFANSTYVSPQDVISKVDNEIITINGVSKDAVESNFIGNFDLNYTLTVQFKDGRIRINAPSINKMINYSTKIQEMFLVGGTDLTGSYFAIFNKKGELKSRNAKISLEEFMEGLIGKMIEFIDSEKDEEW